MKLSVLMYIYILFSNINNIMNQESSKNIIIDDQYIQNNFQSLSRKENLMDSIKKISKSGNYTLLTLFLDMLNSKNINFQKEYQNFIQKKHMQFEKIFNKLKYKDETSIKRISPAFEWAENERVVLMYIKHSSLLNSLSCPYVDGEKLVIRKNNQDIHYEAKCILDNNYMFFNLDLKLFGQVEKIEKQKAERGETRYVIKKKVNVEWDGKLTERGYKLPENSSKMF